MNHLFFAGARLRSTVLLAALCLASISCDKREDLSPSQPLTGHNATQDGSIPCYQFNWETSTYMPSASSMNNNPVQMPWNSGGPTIDPNIVSDYKSVDGWELMYNTFTPTTQLNDPGYKYFFALYNRYRGQLRFYIWKNSTALATTHVNHGLSLYTVSGTSKLLNYNVVDIVPKTNQLGFSTVLNQQLSAAGGTWLVTQYEMAYDPTLANTSFPNMGLRLKSDWVNITQAKLNGTTTGTIKGIQGNPDPGEFSFGSFFQSFFQKGVITLLGTAGSAAIFGGSGGTAAPYLTALNNAGAGLVKDFFSGILGGLSGANASTPIPISLTINSKIEMNGTLVTNGNIIDLQLALPGQANSASADGNIPCREAAMGVFSLSTTPVVKKETVASYSTGPWEDPQYGNYDEPMQEDKYTLDPNSFSIVWNPSLINSSSTGASIANIKKEVVAIGLNGMNGGFVDSPSPMCNCGGRSPYIMIPQGHGHGEIIGQVGAAISDESVPLLLDYSQNYGGVSLESVAVRISFDVVPNSGAPKTKIVKTFYANVQE